MPSDKKRINLTVSDSIYEQLQEYKEINGIQNDASACLQLIVQQLKSQKNTRIMIDTLKKLSTEELKKMASASMDYVKEAIDKEPEKN